MENVCICKMSGSFALDFITKVTVYLNCIFKEYEENYFLSLFLFFIYSLQELRQYLSNLADQCNSENNAVDMPLVIILDNLHHVSSLGEIFNGLLNCKYHKW